VIRVQSREVHSGGAKRLHKVGHINPALFLHVVDPPVRLLVLPEPIFLDVVFSIARLDAVARHSPLTPFPDGLTASTASRAVSAIVSDDDRGVLVWVCGEWGFDVVFICAPQRHVGG
jgi:hypothetical protein